MGILEESVKNMWVTRCQSIICTIRLTKAWIHANLIMGQKDILIKRKVGITNHMCCIILQEKCPARVIVVGKVKSQVSHLNCVWPGKVGIEVYGIVKMGVVSRGWGIMGELGAMGGLDKRLHTTC